jgi:hypothetical protein
MILRVNSYISLNSINRLMFLIATLCSLWGTDWIIKCNKLLRIITPLLWRPPNCLPFQTIIWIYINQKIKIPLSLFGFKGLRTKRNSNNITATADWVHRAPYSDVMLYLTILPASPALYSILQCNIILLRQTYPYEDIGLTPCLILYYARKKYAGLEV